MEKIYVITTSRADAGILKYVMNEMDKQSVNYEHLDFQEIYGYAIEKGLRYISHWFNRVANEDNIKNIMIVGDRWETLQIALIAKMNNINIFHLAGGEVSRGAYDDLFRKAISQMSDYHFVFSVDAFNNLRQHGIYDNIYITGSPRLDNDKTNLKKINYPKTTGLVIYHPTTKKDKAYEEITELIDSLRYLDMNYIILYPNKDKGSEVIIQELEEFALQDSVRLEEKVSLNEYYTLLNSVDILIGNSSAGIKETASYNLPTVNIGDRQLGRDCNDNVLHAKCEKHDIIKAINIALTDGFKQYCDRIENKFGDGHASERIVKIVKEVL